jgi:3-hydroxyisobutyrate dehydrogenase
MGLPMARNLVAAGHEVVGCDLDPARGELFGGAFVSTPAEAVAAAEVAIASLPSPAAVKEVAYSLRGAGVAAFVDMSTGPPALARCLAEELGAAGIDSLDAPVSGGPIGAEAASLTIFVGGSSAGFARVEPVLGALGSVAHVGGPGTGQVVKLCNNLMAGVNMAAIAEAAAVAARAGIDTTTFYKLVTQSTGDSRVMRTRFPLEGADATHPANRAFEPMFALDLMEKDLALACALAEEHDLDSRVARAALRDYRRAQARGLGALDYSAVYLAK